jgi:hypothetical protein
MEETNKKQWCRYKMVAIGGYQMEGGILTLWNPQVLSLIEAKVTRHTLTVHMQIIGNKEVILCTNVYGPQVSEEKRGMIRDLEDLKMLELLHTHLGFIFPKVFPCLLVIISHYPVSYILGENIPPGEYSLSVDTSV